MAIGGKLKKENSTMSVTKRDLVLKINKSTGLL